MCLAGDRLPLPLLVSVSFTAMQQPCSCSHREVKIKIYCIRVICCTLHKFPSPLTSVYSPVTFARTLWMIEEKRVA